MIHSIQVQHGNETWLIPTLIFVCLNVTFREIPPTTVAYRWKGTERRGEGGGVNKLGYYLNARTSISHTIEMLSGNLATADLVTAISPSGNVHFPARRSAPEI